ncbi:alcohol dehydrogenase catalytic domain-containing protein [Leifsonia shinshuensis]|uniref:alcohol dehydrogenase catalytic domain-containing protein n=1 Tax=Leifsonia shinshuensis TaxID=150026 RepID=UPI00285B17A8|nr:alcohol dehydrogenase catalytic domain-containing protein [Leifsonia shinshuensis]MDR6971856.1 putative phosphonate catabolism associated alcohol dehydrogenase [Leifsonia shinshuensis]
MTIKAVTPRVVAPPARLGMGVSVYPSATAMVWPGEGHTHEAVAVPGVRLAPGDVLAQVELATVCGSDIHTVLGHRQAPAPLVLGHEQVGRVIALGRGGAKTTDGHRVELGERVVWSVAVPCGRCARCRRGLPQRCSNLQKYGHERMRRGWELSGGFATHAHILDGTPLVRVPEDIPAVVLAPASCATATVAAAVEAAEAIVPLDGALVLIAGAGMMGLTAAAMATDAGARVVVSDPIPQRREAALAFGAVGVADPSPGADHATSLPTVLAKAGGRGAAPVAALELSGNPAAVRTLLDGLDIGGVLVLVGSVSPGPDLAVAPEQLVRRLLTIRGVHNYAPRHLEQAVRFLASAWQRYPFAEQVGETFPLAEVDRALASAAYPRVAVRP